MSEPGSRARSTGKMRRFWDERAAENPMWYVDTSLDFNAPDEDRFWATGQRIVEHAVTDAPVRSAGHAQAVEIGSGLGRVCLALAEFYDRVVGVDISPHMVDQARRAITSPAVSFELGDGASLAAVADDSTDLVVSFTVFQHIPDTEVIADYVREAGRVLRAGGVAALEFNNEPGARWWTLRRALLDALQRTGVRPEARGRNAAQYLGSKLSMAEMDAMLADAGLRREAATGEGTLFCWVWARKDAVEADAGSSG